VIEIKLFGGFNIEKLQLLGSGTQGRVYRIDALKCIKIFKSRKACRDELDTLILAQVDSHFPRLYSYGENYIIRELINGIELDTHLLSNKLTPDISHKIIELYDAMLKIGFSRLDTALFHIFITTSGELKLIDTAKAMKKTTVYPDLIIKGLRSLGYKNQFLSYVENKRPELYMKWSQHYSKIY
jgi:RIO-like serine/threonine protein kinase